MYKAFRTAFAYNKTSKIIVGTRSFFFFFFAQKQVEFLGLVAKRNII